MLEGEERPRDVGKRIIEPAMALLERDGLVPRDEGRRLLGVASSTGDASVALRADTPNPPVRPQANYLACSFSIRYVAIRSMSAYVIPRTR